MREGENESVRTSGKCPATIASQFASDPDLDIPSQLYSPLLVWSRDSAMLPKGYNNNRKLTSVEDKCVFLSFLFLSPTPRDLNVTDWQAVNGRKMCTNMRARSHSQRKWPTSIVFSSSSSALPVSSASTSLCVAWVASTEGDGQDVELVSIELVSPSTSSIQWLACTLINE